MSISPQDIGLRASVHLLSRAGFGPRPGEARAVLSRGLDRWIREQLDPGPDPELDTRLQRLPTLGYSLSQTVALYGSDNNAALQQVTDDFVSAKVIRAVH